MTLMGHARWALVVLLGCSACKRGGGEAPAPKVAVVDAGGAAVAPDAGALVEVPLRQEVPDSASTLSYVTPGDGGTCVWMRADPAANRFAELGAVPEPCAGARIAWPGTADAGHALIWFDPEARAGSTLPGAAYPSEDSIPVEPSGRVYELFIATGEVRALAPLPADAGHVQEVAYSKGEPTVLVLQPLEVPMGEAKNVTMDGVELTFEPSMEGLAALAHAYRLQDGAWKRVETKTTGEASDGALGVSALEAAAELGPRTADSLAPRAQGDVVEDTELLRRLSPLRPEGGEGGWIFLGSSAGRFYVWEEQIEFPFTMGNVVFAMKNTDGGQYLSRPPQLGFTPKDFVAVRSRGPFVLVAEADSGRHPRLYDAADGSLVWKNDSAWATTFWPGTFEAPREHAE